MIIYLMDKSMEKVEKYILLEIKFLVY